MAIIRSGKGRNHSIRRTIALGLFRLYRSTSRLASFLCRRHKISVAQLLEQSATIVLFGRNRRVRHDADRKARP
jgi:hypothetical protein